MTPSGIITDAALVIDRSRIAWIGRLADLPTELDRQVGDVHDAGGAVVTPGLIDAHTHPVYVEPRLSEIARRTEGASYLEMAREGGGIAATIRTTRAHDPTTLEALVARRLAAWLAAGTTTAEVKTGYHLDRDGELAATAMLHGLAGRPGIPALVVTFLAAHAVPPGDGLDQPAYTRLAASWSRAAAEAGADACDVFCDEGYFTVAEARTILESGRAAGLSIRIHADELARTGGARLAAEIGAASADHLLCCTAADAVALAAAGVVATLCPVTALSMGRRPPIEAFRAAGTRIALGTDHNPGTSGVASMSLVVTLAVAALGLSVEEALAAATTGGAASLRLGDRGRMNTGQRADIVAWDADHEGAFGWAWGLRPRTVWQAGRRVTSPATGPGACDGGA